MQVPALHIDPATLNLKRLPFGMQELARTIGIGPALKLAETFPGIPIYVPAKASMTHPIAQAIGVEAMQQLCERYGPDYYPVPKLDRVLAQIRNQLVRELRAQHYSTRQIALALNYSERHVIRVCKALPAPKRNRDLFDDKP